MFSTKSSLCRFSYSLRRISVLLLLSIPLPASIMWQNYLPKLTLTAIRQDALHDKHREFFVHQNKTQIALMLSFPVL